MAVRRRVVKKKGAARETSLEKKPKRPPVTPQFHYIKNCIHDLKGKSCPMCKLIEKETAAWIQSETERNTLTKMHNFYRRAEMRFGIFL